MGNAVKTYLSTLGVVIAIPALEASIAIVRLRRQAQFFDICEMAIVIVALVAMWLSFRQFTRAIDDTVVADKTRRLLLPVWRIAVFGAASLQLVIWHVGR